MGQPKPKIKTNTPTTASSSQHVHTNDANLTNYSYFQCSSAITLIKSSKATCQEGLTRTTIEDLKNL